MLYESTAKGKKKENDGFPLRAVLGERITNCVLTAHEITIVRYEALVVTIDHNTVTVFPFRSTGRI